MQDLVKTHREKLVEEISGTDDVLMEKYLRGQEISVDELKKALRAAVIANKIVPVLAGSSLRNKGVQPMLDAVVEYLPSPRDVEKADSSSPLSALAFKIQVDPHVGKLTYIRVYSGTLKSGSYVYNSTK